MNTQPFHWPDAAILALLARHGDGPFFAEDIHTVRQFLADADQVRAQLIEAQAQARPALTPDQVERAHAQIDNQVARIWSNGQ